MSVPEFLDPSVVTGVGSGILGLVGGALAGRTGRIARLESEVAECRKRDARVEILEAGVRLMVGEMRRKVPESEALRMFADLCARRFGPPAADLDDFQNLLDRLDKLDGSSDAQS